MVTLRMQAQDDVDALVAMAQRVRSHVEQAVDVTLGSPLDRLATSSRERHRRGRDGPRQRRLPGQRRVVDDALLDLLDAGVPAVRALAGGGLRSSAGCRP